MNKLLLIVTLIIIGITPIYAQKNEHEHDHDEHDHEMHDHSMHTSEIGIANSIVFFPSENETAYGLHLHYVRTLKHTNFGIGIGYERIFDEHGHNSLGIVGAYRGCKNFVFSLSPGVAFEDEHPSELNFTMHTEVSYDFSLKHIHLGPLVEFAVDKEDYHISFGLHIGFGL